VGRHQPDAVSFHWPEATRLQHHAPHGVSPFPGVEPLGHRQVLRATHEKDALGTQALLKNCPQAVVLPHEEQRRDRQGAEVQHQGAQLTAAFCTCPGALFKHHIFQVADGIGCIAPIRLQEGQDLALVSQF